MLKKLLVVFLVCGITVSLVSACSVTSGSFSTTPLTLEAQITTKEPQTLVIYTPASTSSIPVILAAAEMDNVELTLYTNQSQANAIFLRGDAQMLVSGLSVGVEMYRNEAPVQVINSFVTGLSYLVTFGKPVSSFSDLKGESVYVPFEGSPIEEVTAFLVESEGIDWKSDVPVVYSPFDSSIELLKNGSARAVILPEPNVTLVEGTPDIFVSLSLFDEWNEKTNSTDGYPQVATFVNPDWATSNNARIVEFNNALVDAIELCQQDPEAAISKAASFYKLPAEKLMTSLNRTRFNFTAGAEMESTIEDYYQTIGKALDENFKGFYFITAQ